MKVFRIDLSSWTASFRYPNLISGVQPCLDVPPLSTVLGLLNGCAGKYLSHHDSIRIGYYFEYGARAWDMETIYQIESSSNSSASNNAKTNIIQREFLFEANLSVYLENGSMADLFKSPVYPLLLGRSGDLATVNAIQAVELPEIRSAGRIKGQIVPFAGNRLPGKLQALPRYFTDDIPRQNIGTEPFSILRYDAPDAPSSLTCYRDESKGKNGVDIYFHNFSTADVG